MERFSGILLWVALMELLLFPPLVNGDRCLCQTQGWGSRGQCPLDGKLWAFFHFVAEEFFAGEGDAQGGREVRE